MKVRVTTVQDITIEVGQRVWFEDRFDNTVPLEIIEINKTNITFMLDNTSRMMAVKDFVKGFGEHFQEFGGSDSEIVFLD